MGFKRIGLNAAEKNKCHTPWLAIVCGTREGKSLGELYNERHVYSICIQNNQEDVIFIKNRSIVTNLHFQAYW